MKSKGEAGYASILVLGFTLIAIGVAGIAIDATRAFLYRRSLQNAADAAALAGASEVDRKSYYASAGLTVELDPTAARARAAEWLGLRGLEVGAQIDATDENVRVVLSGEIDTTFLRVLGITGMPVGAESLARPLSGEP
jgi:hypothetical protein